MWMKQKPLTFMELRNRYHFDIEALARTATVDPVVVRSMLTQHPVYKAQAEKVLKAFSTLSGVEYSLDTLNITYFPEQGRL